MEVSSRRGRGLGSSPDGSALVQKGMTSLIPGRWGTSDPPWSEMKLGWRVIEGEYEERGRQGGLTGDDGQQSLRR